MGDFNASVKAFISLIMRLVHMVAESGKHGLISKKKKKMPQAIQLLFKKSNLDLYVPSFY